MYRMKLCVPGLVSAARPAPPCSPRRPRSPLLAALACASPKLPGRHTADPARPPLSPPLCRWSTDPVRARSKFWYFLRKLKKVKKSNGQIITVNEIFEEHPTVSRQPCALRVRVLPHACSAAVLTPRLSPLPCRL